MTDNLIPFRLEWGADVSDDLLIAACARGDNTAIEELFQRHGERVHRILARTGAVGPSDLDDVVQAAFIAVQRGARKFDRRSAVGTWIVGIALNVARRHARGEARRRSAMFALAEAQPLHHRAGPEEQAANRQLIARLFAGFEKLPRDLRTVFALCDLEGMRGVDVAQALGVPPGTIWRRLYDARSRLRALMEADHRR